MRGVFMFALLAQVLCVRSETCADDLCAALQQDDSSGAVELLQVKSKQESKDSKEDSTETEVDAESKHGEEWVHYNPPGWRGGPGRGYVHHNQVVALPMFITIPLDGKVARATAPPTFIMVATATGITQRCTTTTDGVETLRRRDVLRL